MPNNVKEKMNDKYFLWISIGVLALCATLILVKALIFHYDGVVVIGKKVTVYEGGDSYPSWVYEFNLSGKQYERTFTTAWTTALRQDSLIYIKVSLHVPVYATILPDTRVPACITMKDQPSKGWATMPLCNHTKSNVADAERH